MKPEPRFIYSHDYKYNKLENVIYGKEKYSRLYWHEYRHYLDSSSSYYDTVDNLFNIYFTLCLLVIFLSFIYYLFVGFNPLYFERVYWTFFPVVLWYIQEEFRAEIFSIYKKYL